MAAFKTIALGYSLFLQKHYQKLCHLPGFVLLESTDKNYGRYDILSAYPYHRIIINENSANKKVLLEQLIQEIPLSSSSCHLPFQGGAIGYISYDLGAKLVDIESKPQESLSDVPLLDMGLYDWAIIADHQEKKVTLFAANQCTETEDIIKEIINLWDESHCKESDFKVTSDFIPLISQDEYRESFTAIHQELISGRSYQVNFTQPFHASYEGDTWQMYHQISKKNPVPFSAFIRNEHANILSFSPERFLLHDKRKIRTSPIKGTKARSHDLDEDNQLKNQLEQCEKNRAENIMIVDLLRNDLGQIAQSGSVHVQSLCAVQSYNAVHHLVSDVEAICLEDLHPIHAFISCFPGGSITGAPKLEAMKIIQEQEAYGRGVYCGSIGYFSRHGRYDSNVAIRTITAKNNLLHLAAGGGIVIDSKWEDEYRECYIKIAAIIDGLK